MASATLMSAAEYLIRSFDPDREFVDGVLIERNVGEKKHSRLQIRLAGILLKGEVDWRIVAYTEQRVQVSSSRFRVPDLCVELAPGEDSPIITVPPFLCIEILSPDDRASDTMDKINDYLKFGVAYVWLIDPYKKKAWIYTRQGSREAEDKVLRTHNPDIEIPLDPIWPELG